MEVRFFFDELLSGNINGKMRPECEKIISPVRVGGRRRCPGEALESAKSVRIVRVCKSIWNALSSASRGRRILCRRLLGELVLVDVALFVSTASIVSTMSR